MKKLMLLAAMLAIAVLAVTPAVAQFFDNDLEQEAESDGVGLSFSASVEGDNSNQCAPALQFGNTGNNQNAATINQYFSSGGASPSGGEISFEPELENECAQSVEQAAAAGR